MNGRPFSDTGDERVIRFSALGLDWTVRAENTYEHVLVAERFAAAAQVLLVELANKDLCFLRTSIDIRVKPSAGGSGETTWQGSNEGRRWTVTLMAGPDDVRKGRAGAPEHEVELLAALTTIFLTPRCCRGTTTWPSLKMRIGGGCRTSSGSAAHTTSS